MKKNELIERMVEIAAFELGSTIPSERGKVFWAKNPDRRPGAMILNMKPEERAILSTLTAEDLNKYRLDWILMWVPNYPCDIRQLIKRNCR